MANQNHIDILRLGVSEWNKWRVERTGIVPDLRGADLREASLSGADLRAVNLRGANLSGANLRGANLRAADLRAADLKGTILWSASLTGADLRSADLSGADLRGVNFRAANLMNTILVGVATNDYTDFRHATVTGARLWEDEEPVEDWQTELTTIADKYAFKALVKIEFGDHICAAELAAVLQSLDAALYEYERTFIESFGGVVGESLCAACLHRLTKERKKIVRCLRFETAAVPGTGIVIETVLAPVGFLLVGRAVFGDVEDLWKRTKTSGTIKKALIHRANQAVEDLQKLLRVSMNGHDLLGRFDLTIQANRETLKAPDLLIEFIPRKSAESQQVEQAPAAGNPAT